MKTDAMLKVEFLDPNSLVPYAGNAKKHSDDQIEKLARLIQKNGWTQPIVVDKDKVIIAGHGRRLAALKLGLKKVPVVVRGDLSKEEADGLRLADNRVASTEYDTALLQQEMLRLNDIGIDLEDFAFDTKEIASLTVDFGEFDESAFVEDVGEAVDEQKEENAKKQEEVEETAAPIADAFGFKRISVAQSRRVRRFMSAIEDKTGQKGIDALIAHLDEQGL